LLLPAFTAKKEPPTGEVLCISHAASFLSLDSVSVEVAIRARPLARPIQKGTHVGQFGPLHWPASVHIHANQVEYEVNEKQFFLTGVSLKK
jgi:hypothetical protein